MPPPNLVAVLPDIVPFSMVKVPLICTNTPPPAYAVFPDIVPFSMMKMPKLSTYTPPPVPPSVLTLLPEMAPPLISKVA